MTPMWINELYSWRTSLLQCFDYCYGLWRHIKNNPSWRWTSQNVWLGLMLVISHSSVVVANLIVTYHNKVTFHFDYLQSNIFWIVTFKSAITVSILTVDMFHSRFNTIVNYSRLYCNINTCVGGDISVYSGTSWPLCNRVFTLETNHILFSVIFATHVLTWSSQYYSLNMFNGSSYPNKQFFPPKLIHPVPVTHQVK